MQESYYIFSQGKIFQKDNTIRFISIDGVKKDLPIENVKEIYFLNEISVTSKFLSLLSKHGVVAHFFNHYQFYIGSYYPRETKTAGQLLVQQALTYSDYSNRLSIATEFIKSASANIYRNLRYYNSREKNVSEQMEKIEELRKHLDRVNSIEELMGVEGNIRQTYYRAWNEIINQEINFDKRVYHPADNMINSLISYVNSLIYTKTLSEIYKTQLNPTISFLHEPSVRRFSLALDISEIFKPLLADRMIFSLLNKNQITANSFNKDLNGLQLTESASKTIVSELDNRMKKTIFHKELKKSVSYQYLIRLEAYKLIKHILGEKEYKGFEIWW